MEDSARNGLHDILASRRAEEAAWRRYQAVEWLNSFVGPLGISTNPSEREFISCLRNGLVLCNAINKVHPGAVPKVVENSSPLQSTCRDYQPPQAYQYFENVKNFLVAVEELKLPAFEASDLEKDPLEAGSATKVVDCLLALKSYNECKQTNGANGFYKPIRSPMVSASRSNSRSISLESCRQLDLSKDTENQQQGESDGHKLKDVIVKIVSERLADLKENVDESLFISLNNGNKKDAVRFLRSILTKHLEDDTDMFPEMMSIFKDHPRERRKMPPPSIRTPFEDLSVCGNSTYCRACSIKGGCNHRQLFQMQEKELLDLKALLTMTKREFEDLQSQFQRDLRNLGTQVDEMSTAALGYHRVLKENRNLYNMVQDLKGNIRVYCRIRPVFTAGTTSVIDFIGDDGSLVISDSLKNGRKVFQFNRVFDPKATQAEVYQDTRPLIRSVMDGYNVCIFAYGQTGSGKTYTMSGPPCGESTKDMGINYLALNDLFELSNQRKDIMAYDIQVQMVEIYNEQVRDLLAEDSSATRLEIRSCAGDDGLALPNATVHSVNNTADVLSLMKLGEVNRAVSSTAMNNRSSRSHSVLTVHVHGRDESTGSTLRSCLHLVDLAGSERVDKSEVTGDRLKEAQFINKSLSSIGDVITALAQKNSYIPYRNSKLTLLLQDSLGGHAKTLMFAHVSPDGDSFGETISTLKFAQRVSTVELSPAHANKASGEVMQLKEQVDNLKKALAIKESQNVQLSKMTPYERPKSMTEQTPPRLRRLSVENGSNVKQHNTVTRETFKTTPSVPSRSRRLSLEGPRYTKKAQDAEAVSKPFVCPVDAPRSPTSTPFQKRIVNMEIKTQIPSLRLPMTPEQQQQQQHVARNEVQILMQSELTVTADSQAMNVTSANGKGSHIRKSLRNIGRLINGSEKRNQQNPKEARSPLRGISNHNDVKSPVRGNTSSSRRQSLTGKTGNANTLSRRQSLTGGGIQVQGSQRSSLGGKSIEDDSRKNAKTPIRVDFSMKTGKR